MPKTEEGRSFIAAFTFLLALPATIFAEAPYSVKVDVTSQDEALKASVYSYVTRDLRKIRDVSIVDSDEQFRLRFIAQKSEAAGREFGYSLSVVVLRSERDQDMEFLWMTVCKGADPSVLRILTSPLVQLEQYQLFEGGTSQDMQEQLSLVVADFEKETLDRIRSADAIREKGKSLRK